LCYERAKDGKAETSTQTESLSRTFEKFGKGEISQNLTKQENNFLLEESKEFKDPGVLKKLCTEKAKIGEVEWSTQESLPGTVEKFGDGEISPIKQQDITKEDLFTVVDILPDSQALLKKTIEYSFGMLKDLPKSIQYVKSLVELNKESFEKMTKKQQAFTIYSYLLEQVMSSFEKTKCYLDHLERLMKDLGNARSIHTETCECLMCSGQYRIEVTKYVRETCIHKIICQKNYGYVISPATDIDIWLVSKFDSDEFTSTTTLQKPMNDIFNNNLPDSVI